MDQEKRRRTRVPAHFDATVSLRGETIGVRIANISLTGILCGSSPLFRKGDACKVILSLSDELKITVEARILRVGEKETAISFASMDEESFVHLKRLVQYNTGDADLIDGELRTPAFD